MKNEKLEKYISELSPELQEKARECKTNEELNVLLAENDVELSEDALQAVAGGCSSSDEGERVIEKYEVKSYCNWNPSYNGARVDGALMTNDKHSKIHYYIITARGNEPATAEVYRSMIERLGMVKV